ncbi:DinB superfamily protein [Lutibacter agarilyticus]|uniref:DinB superfamily protein n=1 Tax=Lutibacter agarilyticus TaxID=1109740 RepID=A0A238VFZ6_9FLAO|nr:putative metal-dependent hydrolase [Lutibacter agarilyticus]SNR33315.1 DinB superfamily protein [Lutibacter agarilyticus]
MMEDLKYPIGQAIIPSVINENQLNEWIVIIENFPSKLDKLVKHLDNDQLNTPYRENGWTIRQVIHHCADSHQNSYIRFKWTLTEDKPIIKAYFEDKWAKLFDSKSAPILLSINVLKAVHAKWIYLLKGLTSKNLKLSFIHPESKELVSLEKNIGIYAWHCNHHYAHIYNLMKQQNWLIS